jgi:hypothetical protein
MAMKRNRSRRERLELAIKKAIALLDELDGDPDLEPSAEAFQSATKEREWPGRVAL